MFNKRLGIILAVSMVFAFFPSSSLPSFAASEPWSYSLTAVNSGTDADQYFAGGSGTQGDPYQIYTAQELANLAYAVNNSLYSCGDDTVYYQLSNDIDLNDWTDSNHDNIVDESELSSQGGSALQWTPIGTDDKRFKGHFDGNGYTIAGLYSTEANYQSLFGYAEGAVIENVTASGYTHGNSYHSGILAYGESSEIKSCINEVSVSGASYIGGIVAQSNGCNITDCKNEGPITGSNSYVGGIAARATEGSVINHCENSGAVSGGGNNTGGIAGFCAASTIENCMNAGTVSGSYYTGGIAGDNQGTVQNCYNRAAITAISEYSGGITGSNYGTTANSYSVGIIAGSQSGGLVGQNYGVGAVINSFWLEGSASNGAGTVDSGTYLSGCGTFSGNTITAGTAATCDADQILLYGTELLEALNKWAVRENAETLCSWGEDTDDTNDGYPILGNMITQKRIEEQPDSSNGFTLSATNVSGVSKAYQWYRFNETTGTAIMDLAVGDVGWDRLTNSKPGGFGLTDTSGYYSYGHSTWTTTGSIYKSGSHGSYEGAGYCYSAMTIPITTTGGQDIYYEWKVSSEPGCDYLLSGLYKYDGGNYSLVPGQSVESISGEVDWTAKTISGLDAGTYYLVVVYTKDPNKDSGDDCGYVRLAGSLDPISGKTTATLDRTGLTAGERFCCGITYSDGVFLMSDNISFEPIALITSNLTGVTSSNSEESVVLNGSYSTILTQTNSDDTLSVTVTMGGSDITDTVYDSSTKQISIPSVTGDIVITAVSSNSDTSGSPHHSSRGKETNTDPSSASVIIDGKTVVAGISETTTDSNGQTTTTVILDASKLQKALDSAGSDAIVTLPIMNDSDVMAGILTGQMVKNMENEKASLQVKTERATYTIPASEININAVSQTLGQNIDLTDISVEVKIAEPDDQSVKIVDNAAQDGSFSIMVPPVEFTVNCTYAGKTVEVSKYNAYVKRNILIPDGVDPKKITTAIVIDSDGSVRQIPTDVQKIKGKYYAVVNSLTNSVYTLIYNEKTFSDIANKWYADVVNEMAARKIVNGTTVTTFDGSAGITRAQFAQMIVNALGLPSNGSGSFSDVPDTAWYAGAVGTAYEYGIINGTNGKFMPNNKITRQDAMLMLERAAAITGYVDTASPATLDFADLNTVSGYAKDAVYWNIENGFIKGSGGMVRPKNEITRAECATVLLRLLQKSDLIDVRTAVS